MEVEEVAGGKGRRVSRKEGGEVRRRRRRIKDLKRLKKKSSLPVSLSSAV